MLLFCLIRLMVNEIRGTRRVSADEQALKNLARRERNKKETVVEQQDWTAVDCHPLDEGKHPAVLERYDVVP